MEKLSDILAKVLSASEAGGQARLKAAYFVLDNCIFGHPYEVDGDEVCLVREEDSPNILEKVGVFVAHLGETDDEKSAFLLSVVKERYPQTGGYLEEFFTYGHAERTLPVLDYLAARLECELPQMDDNQLYSLVTEMAAEAPISSAKRLALFAAWVRLKKGGTSYHGDVLVAGRRTRTTREAYGLELYACMYYYFFNEGYVQSIHMYIKACDNAEYAFAVSYICIHLVCAVRDTDIFRFPHPELPFGAEETLERIRNGSLGDEEAASAARSVMNYLKSLHMKPNKTRSHTGVPDVTIHIPQSLEAHFGRLLLICKAHLVLEGKPEGTPLFKRVTSYRKLKELFEEEVYTLFKDHDCSPVSFTKSHMQALSAMAAASSLPSHTGSAIITLTIAGLARSHKADASSFSVATLSYLKDCALGVLAPDMVALELFERGALSCVTSEFLCILTGNQYATLDFEQQTRLGKELGLSSLEIEQAMGFFLEANREAINTLKAILAPGDERARREQITHALHRIASGFAPGKDLESHCFVHALGKPCIHPEYRGCLACPYKVDTRATLYLAVGELRRLRRLREEAVTEGSKKKYDMIAKQYLLPSIMGIMTGASAIYGQEAGRALGAIIHEAMGDEKREEEKK